MQEGYSDKYDSGNKREDEQNGISNVAYPLVVGMFLTRQGFLMTFLDLLLAGGWSDSDSAIRFFDVPAPASVLAGTEGGAHEIGVGSRGSKIWQSSSSSSSETRKIGM